MYSTTRFSTHGQYQEDERRTDFLRGKKRMNTLIYALPVVLWTRWHAAGVGTTSWTPLDTPKLARPHPAVSTCPEGGDLEGGGRIAEAILISVIIVIASHSTGVHNVWQRGGRRECKET